MTAGVVRQRRRPRAATARRATRPSAPPTARRAASDGRLAVLTVGGIEPRKGSLTLLEAFAAAARARSPSGDPCCSWRRRRHAVRLPRRDRPLRRRARAQLGLDGDLRVLGPVDGRRARAPVPRRRRASRSRRSKEGFGLVVLEALAVGPAGRRLRPRRVPRVPGRRRQRAARPCRRRRRARPRAGAVARDRRARARLRRAARAGSPPAHGWDASAAAHERAYRDVPGARAARRRLMAERLEVTATWRGGYGRRRRRPRARGARRRAARRPAATTPGMMPTELFCAALASCFCLALGHVAAQARRSMCPSLRVTVRRRARGRRAALRAARRVETRGRRSTTTRSPRLLERGAARSAGCRTRWPPGSRWSIVRLPLNARFR